MLIEMPTTRETDRMEEPSTSHCQGLNPLVLR